MSPTAATPRAGLEFKEPFDWSSLLEFFRVRAIPRLEKVTDTSYSRLIRIGRKWDVLTISHDKKTPRLTAFLHSTNKTLDQSSITKVRQLFDLDADPNTIASTLKEPTHLSKALPELRTLRVPGAWDLFEIGVRAILGQQVTVAGARTLAERLVKQYGTLPMIDEAHPGQWFAFPAPAVLQSAPVESIGMPTKRAEAIRRFAAMMTRRKEHRPNPSTFSADLLEIPGIGPWTVNYIRMRGLKDPDAFPEGDIALLNAARSLSLATSMKELKQISEQWRPLRAYATIALWRILNKQKGP